jgi:prolipoprotein diacylglyceryltransferase
MFYHIFSHKSFEKNPFWLLDRLAITVALAGFFIRIGNFFNSEIVGKPAPNFAFAVQFPQDNSYGQ